MDCGTVYNIYTKYVKPGRRTMNEMTDINRKGSMDYQISQRPSNIKYKKITSRSGRNYT